MQCHTCGATFDPLGVPSQMKWVWIGGAVGFSAVVVIVFMAVVLPRLVRGSTPTVTASGECATFTKTFLEVCTRGCKSKVSKDAEHHCASSCNDELPEATWYREHHCQR